MIFWILTICFVARGDFLIGGFDYITDEEIDEYVAFLGAIKSSGIQNNLDRNRVISKMIRIKKFVTGMKIGMNKRILTRFKEDLQIYEHYRLMLHETIEIPASMLEQRKKLYKKNEGRIQYHVQEIHITGNNTNILTDKLLKTIARNENIDQYNMNETKFFEDAVYCNAELRARFKKLAENNKIFVIHEASGSTIYNILKIECLTMPSDAEIIEELKQEQIEKQLRMMEEMINVTVEEKPRN